MPNAASSGSWFLFLGTGAQQVAANSSTPFELLSLFLTGPGDTASGNSGQSDSVLIEGFTDVLDQFATYSVLVTPTSTPTQYFLNFIDIERVLFTPIAAGPFAARIGLDDFAFIGTPTAIEVWPALPEPSSIALVGLALLGVVWSRKPSAPGKPR
jgi:hypothetical protein